MKYFLYLSISLLTLCACDSGQSQTVTKVDKATVLKMIDEDPELALIDVRTAEEVAGGIIENSINIDWNGPDFKSNVEQLDKSKPVVVYCMSGKRSAAASEYLVEAGFQQVFDLEGGYLSWIE